MPPGQQAGPGAVSCSSSWKGSRIFSWRAEKNSGQDQTKEKQEVPEKVAFDPGSIPARRTTQADPPCPSYPGGQLLGHSSCFSPRQGRSQELVWDFGSAFIWEMPPAWTESRENLPFLSTRLYFRDTQLQGVISLVSPSPSTGWRDHQGEERGFQQIECFVRQGQGWEPGPTLFHQQPGEQWAGRDYGDGPSPPWGRLCTAKLSGEGWLPLGDLREVQLSASPVPMDMLGWLEPIPLWRAPNCVGVQFVLTQAPGTTLGVP